MRYLTRKHWNSFKKPNGQFDGLKFEELVSTLLPKLYKGNWIRTKYSWDGKKDFYLQGRKELRWAECKAYQKPISINVISPTLIMALIKDVQVILLFSYTPINTNARLYLAQFASLTGRQIRYFDDESLEDLILSHADVKRFFPFFSGSYLLPAKKPVVNGRISQDPDIEYSAASSIEEENQNIYLSLLSTFSIDVLVRNDNTASVINGKLRLNSDDLINNFFLYNEDIRQTSEVPFSLQGGETFFYRFYFRARRAGKLSAPRIVLNYGENYSEPIDLKPIEVSSILAVPLIGAGHINALNTLKQKARARHKPVFFHLHGGSGTGKSRLLREFRDELLGLGYSIFAFNCENEANSSFDHFVKRLISTVCKLPMLEDVIKPDSANDNFVKETTKQVLLEILYNDAMRPSQNRKLAIQLIVELLRDRKTAILIDNIQFLDEDTIFLINTVITNTAGTAVQNVWVTSLNTEMLSSEMPASKLNSRIKSLAAENSDFVIPVEITDFSEDDARLFLDQALEGELLAGEFFSEKYPETSALILKKAGKRPLFLEQTLQYVSDLGGLGLSSGRLYVKDIDIFHTAINSLPHRLHDLIEKRWEYISGHLTKGAKFLIRSLAELISIPVNFTIKLGITRSDIYSLVNLGLVNITESNNIRFHHHQHYLFFSELYAQLDRTFAKKLLNAIEDANYVRMYPFQTVILKDATDQFSDKDLHKIAAIIVENRVTGAAKLRTTPYLLELFNRPDIKINPGIELKVVSNLCQELKHYASYDKAALAFATAYNYRKDNLVRYRNYGENYYEFVRNFSNAFFALRRDSDARFLLDTSLNEMPKFRFKTGQSRLSVKSKLLNRLCVALRSINDIASAEESVRESLAIAEEITDRRLIYKNYIDWGYIYHGLKQHNTELIDKWSTGLKIFHDNFETDPTLQNERVSTFHHQAAIYILKQRTDDAVEIIDEGLRYSQRVFSPFHEIKLLLLRVVAELVDKKGEVTTDRLNGFLNMAEDRSITSRALRGYWIVFYLRAKLYWYENRIPESITQFFVALEQIRHILVDPRMEERHRPFFEDFALHMRLSEKTVPEDKIRLIKNNQIRRETKKILSMSSSQFSDWLTSYTPSATYDDGRYNLPVP